MCVVVTALCNQPEAFASDLGDDQSHYLLITCKSAEIVKVREHFFVESYALKCMCLLLQITFCRWIVFAAPCICRCVSVFFVAWC